ncbi:MAG TPA: hypothetical protein VMT55_04885 [Candidatus Sulfotelmatobacter sp.]|nr:hypothetical protein [Candidatus Sulfotelmatobacter sp.]
MFVAEGSRLSRAMVPVRGGRVPSSQEAVRMLGRSDVSVHLPTLGRAPQAEAPEQMSVREVLLIACVCPVMTLSLSEIRGVLAQEGEPALNLTDFGVPVLPDAKATLLTKTPFVQALPLFKPQGIPATSLKDRTAPLSPAEYLSIKGFISIIMQPGQVAYPNHDLAKLVNAAAGAKMRESGIEGLALSDDPTVFYGLEADRVMLKGEYSQIYGQAPNLGVVLVPVE